MTFLLMTFLQVCGTAGFKEQSVWQKHVESEPHCIAVLNKYYSLRYDTYVTLYGDTPYSQVLDLPLDLCQDDSVKARLADDIDSKMAARCGVFLSYECKVISECVTTLGCFVSFVL